MIDEPIQIYEQKLNTLTSASATLINELTQFAEDNLDQSELIVSLIKDRVYKCLPRYKLFAIYLMDSIVKKIGNPYNILFEQHLFKIFVDTYRLVDSNTRQHLIDLFKTWLNGTTNSGLKVFTADVINKIEQFIIKATSLDQQLLRSTDTVQLNERERQFKLPNSIRSEHFIRECNILLQYIITINNQLEAYENTKFFKKNMRIRNGLIYKINDIFDSLFRDHKNFYSKINYYHKNLVEIRSTLDEQNLKQNLFLQSQYKPNLKPDLDFVKVLDNPFQDIANDEMLVLWIKNFGIPIKNEELFKLASPPPETEQKLDWDKLASNPLGLGFLDETLGDGLEDSSHQDIIDNSEGDKDISMKRSFEEPITNDIVETPLKKVRFDE